MNTQKTCLQLKEFLTEHGEGRARCGVAPRPRRRRSAQVRAAVMRLYCRDDQVTVSHHLGAEHIYGFGVGPAPRHQRPGLSLGHTLQNRGMI